MEIIHNLLKWIEDNSTNININIISGIIASFIVIMLQSFARAFSILLASIVDFKIKLKIIWRFDKPQTIYFVSGAIKGVNEWVKSVVLAGPDAEAANILISTSGLLYPTCNQKHVYSSSFLKELYNENLIVIGGPLNNSCSSFFLDKIKDKISFTSKYELIVSKKKYRPSYDENDNTIIDYGAVIRMENPFDKQKVILLIVGCDTFGVLAAATLISSKQEGQKSRLELFKKLGFKKYSNKQNFIAVVECSALGNDIGTINLKVVNIL